MQTKMKNIQMTSMNFIVIGFCVTIAESFAYLLLYIFGVKARNNKINAEKFAFFQPLSALNTWENLLSKNSRKSNASKAI